MSAEPTRIAELEAENSRLARRVEELEADKARLNWLLRGESLTTTRSLPSEPRSLDYCIRTSRHGGRKDIDDMRAGRAPGDSAALTPGETPQ